MKKDIGIFIRYVAFNMLGMIGISFYILADTFFVSKALGSLGLAALNFTIPAYTAMTATGLLLGVGGATQYAILYTRNKIQEGNRIFSLLCVGALVLSIVFITIACTCIHGLTTLLGADAETSPYAVVYLRILFLYSPAFLLNQLMIAFVRNDGDPALAMGGMIFGSFVNIVLDYVFMFPLDMGIKGAALATGFSPICSLLVLSCHFLKKSNHLKLQKFRVKFSIIKKTFQLGISSWITEISSGIVLTGFNIVILKLEGNTGVAAYGIVANISLVALAIFSGIAQGVQPLISQCYGRAELIRMKRFRYLAVGVAMGLAVIFYGIMILFRDEVIQVFNSEQNQALIPLAKEGIALYFVGFIFAGVNAVEAAGCSAVERAGAGFLIAILRGCLIILPLLFIMAELFQMTGVWLTFPLAEFLTMIIALFLVRRTKKA